MYRLKYHCGIVSIQYVLNIVLFQDCYGIVNTKVVLYKEMLQDFSVIASIMVIRNVGMFQDQNGIVIIKVVQKK